MKKYIKELVIFIIQVLVFYLLPLFAGADDAMGLVMLILLSTLILATILGFISKEKIKFLYPLFISISFIPSVFIFYNESALIHAVWYFISSYIGLFIGIILSLVIKNKNQLIS